MQYRRRNRFPWLLIIIGLLLGTAAGLYYAWIINPVNLINIAPAQLNQTDQEAYILLVSETYMQDRNLPRAQARLDLLNEKDVPALVSVQADTAYLSGADTREISALTGLAEALGASPAAAEVFSATLFVQTTPTLPPGSPTPTFEAMAEPTQPPQPAATSTPLVLPPTPTVVSVAENTVFELLSVNTTCPEGGATGVLEIIVTDEAGNGIPAVQIIVQWEERIDLFYTGLNPIISPGYADFTMARDQQYSVTLVNLSEPVVGIDSSACTNEAGRFVTPNIQLIFSPASTDDE